MAPKSSAAASRAGKKLPWLILMPQLPVKPAYQRVKLWRQLQAIGAVGLRNSVYVLPATQEAAASFERIVRELDLHGGDAIIWKSEIIAGLRDDQLRALFNNARDKDYEILVSDMRKLLLSMRRSKKFKPDSAPALVRFRQRLGEIERLDFFEASGRRPAEALLAQLDHSAITREPQTKATTGGLGDITGKIWVTRQDIHVDRIACAWLIKRFIDPTGKLKFVPGKSYTPEPGEFRYDMREGEFTHEGDNCSFETLLTRARLRDPALKAIGEIIHDIDLNDGKFGHPETPGIAHVISGICQTQGTDEARVARGNELFNHIYEQFRRRRK